jgi:6-phosphogluconolactonase
MRPFALAAAALALFASCKDSDETSPGRPAPLPDGGGDARVPDDDASARPDATDGGDAGAKPLGVPRVYVGSGDGKIRLFSFDGTTGALALEDTFDAGENPSFLAFDPERRFVYAVDENASQVQAFAVERPSGKLAALGAVASGGNGPAHVSVDRAGKYVLVANYGGGTIAVFPRQADGRLGAATATRSFGNTAQTHEIVTDPTNAFALVPNKGKDAVSVFRLDGSGALADVSLAGYPAGDGARHLDFDQAGKHVYVVDELASTVTVMTMDPATGALAAIQTISTLEPGFMGANTGAEIQRTPDGKHVLASNRGDDSLAVFDVGASDGKLTRTARVATGKTPRHFSIEETGRFLFAGNQGSGTVTVMKMDATTGIPSPLGSPVAVPSPAWVGLVYLPP